GGPGAGPERRQGRRGPGRARPVLLALPHPLLPPGGARLSQAPRSLRLPRRDARRRRRAAPVAPRARGAARPAALARSRAYDLGRRGRHGLDRRRYARGSRPGRTTFETGGRLMSAKYVFVTGGVVSSLGKGIAASSIGALLEARGYKVALAKF